MVTLSKCYKVLGLGYVILMDSYLDSQGAYGLATDKRFGTSCSIDAIDVL